MMSPRRKQELSYEPPPEKPKPKGSKKERETILVMRATPENAALAVVRPA